MGGQDGVDMWLGVGGCTRVTMNRWVTRVKGRNGFKDDGVKRGLAERGGRLAFPLGENIS